MISHLQSPSVAVVREIARTRNLPVLLVGGAVRDALLGRPAKDLDFSVQGNPIELARAVANRLNGDFYVMDDERGTARVILKDTGSRTTSSFILHPSSFILDFAACRGATWEDDLLARDFTVNAMALDLSTGEVLDPAGGRDDLERRIIRQAGADSIANDPVRALRAVRMALVLGARIETSTGAAVRAAASALSRPSPERVRDELMKLLARADAARGARQLDEFGLLGAVVPEIEPMRACGQSQPHRYDVLEHTFVVLDCFDDILAALSAPSSELADWQLDVAVGHRSRLVEHFATVTSGDRLRAAVFRLSLLLHDCGKPATRTVDADGVTHFYHHPAVGYEAAVARANALKLSGNEIRQIRLTIAHHMRPNLMARQSDVSPRALYRLVRDAGDCLPELALLCVADGVGKAGDQTTAEDLRRRGGMASLLIDRYYTRFAPDVAPPPLIDGRDVLALGIPPGPRIGSILAGVREAHMTGEIATREEALRLAAALSADG